MQQHSDDQMMQNAGKEGLRKTAGVARGVLGKAGKVAGKLVVMGIKKLLILIAPVLGAIVGALLVAFFLYATFFLLPRFITEQIKAGNTPLPKSITRTFQGDGGPKDYQAIFSYGFSDMEFFFEDDLALYKKYVALTENIDPELMVHIAETALRECQRRMTIQDLKFYEEFCKPPAVLAGNIIRDSMDDIRNQASRYRLSWGLLAAVDRITGDPSLHGENTPIGNRNPLPEVRYAALKPHFKTWEYKKEEYENSKMVHEKRQELDSETGEVIGNYWVWVTHHNKNDIHRVLLKEVDTFENYFYLEWDIFSVYINKETVRVTDARTGSVVFSAHPGTPSNQVPPKFLEHYNRMKEAIRAEERINHETGEPYQKNLWWRATYAELKTFHKTGENMRRFMEVVGEYGISSDLEVEFVLRLAQSFDPQFYFDRAEVFHAGDARLITTVRHYIGEAGYLFWPVPGHVRISSPFGNRMHPILKQWRFHSGVDVPAPRGTPVLSAMNGIVIFSGTMGAYGRTIIVDHGEVKTLYAHLHRLEVHRGQKVRGGELIGRVGSTGRATGNHLHFELRALQNGREVFLDPVLFFEKTTESDFD